jgi:hypothetical protein
MSFPSRYSQRVNGNQMNWEIKVESRGPKGWQVGPGVKCGVGQLAWKFALDTRPLSPSLHSPKAKVQSPKSSKGASLFRPIRGRHLPSILDLGPWPLDYRRFLSTLAPQPLKLQP